MSSLDIAEIILIPLAVVFISYFFQKRTQDEIQRQGAQLQGEIEKLKDKLAKERFLAEKHWNEAKSLYGDLSNLFQDIFEQMNGFRRLLFIDKPLFSPVLLLYIHFRIQGFPIEERMYEDSKASTRVIDSTLRPEHFGQLWLKMKEMQGPVTVFASPKIGEVFDELCSLARIFAGQVINRLIILATESKPGLDSYNEIAKDFFLKLDANPETIEDIKPLISDFRKELQEMHRIMRKELSCGSFLEEEESET